MNNDEQMIKWLLIITIVLIFIMVVLMLTEATTFYQEAYRLTTTNCASFNYKGYNITLP